MSILNQIISARQRFSCTVGAKVKHLLHKEDFSEAMSQIHKDAVKDSTVLSLTYDIMSEDQRAIYNDAQLKWEIDSCNLVLGEESAFYPISIQTLWPIFHISGFDYFIYKDSYFEKNLIPNTCIKDFIYSLRPCLGDLLNEFSTYQNKYFQWLDNYSHVWKNQGMTYKELCQQYQIDKVGHCPFLPFPLTLSEYIKDVSKYWEYRKILIKDGLFFKHYDELKELKKRNA